VLTVFTDSQSSAAISGAVRWVGRALADRGRHRLRASRLDAWHTVHVTQAAPIGHLTSLTAAAAPSRSLGLRKAAGRRRTAGEWQVNAAVPRLNEGEKTVRYRRAGSLSRSVKLAGQKLVSIVMLVDNTAQNLGSGTNR
jgi:hypothetical protein